MSKKILQAAAGAGGESVYVEDVFSTYLYEGNGSTQTITNDIDLDGEGGLVWLKSRDLARNNNLYDTERIGTWPKHLVSDSTAAEIDTERLSSFNSNGFSLSSSSAVNASGENYTSWTFRKAKKFCDVVTWTGNGTSQTIAHALNSTIGSIFIKRIDSSFDWKVYHISLGTSQELELNQTGAAASTGGTVTAVSDSSFTVGGGSGVNASGGSYVAYLFAHDAGGFGDDGSESIIKCGSYTGNGQPEGPFIDLGFEPQWLLIKSATAAGNWTMLDNMRGLTGETASTFFLRANDTNAEQGGGYARLSPTGFNAMINSSYTNSNGVNYIYIAIRRPMKTPESGTEVYTNVEGSGADPAYVSGFVTDLGIRRYPAATQGNKFYSRLTSQEYLDSTSTAAKIADSNGKFDYMDAWFDNPDGSGYYGWSFKRATGFFDVVAYSGTGATGQVESHNLGAVPEMIIVKNRGSAWQWAVYHKDLGEYDSGSYIASKNLTLNTTDAETTNSVFSQHSDQTASVFTLGYTNSAITYASGNNYIAYLFATLAGISKVGSYTGTAADLDVDCGFSAGARFILIKRTDSTGDWYVYDSERGIVAGNDPYLLLNSTAAEVTGTDYIDPLSSGFTVTSSAPAGLNASGGSYIFLAIS